MRKNAPKEGRKRQKRGFVSEGQIYFNEEEEQYYKVVCGRPYKCFPSGYLFDYNDNHVSISYGRLSFKPTQLECRIMNLAIDRKMAECFPNSLARKGEIEYVEVESQGKKKLISKRSKNKKKTSKTKPA